MLKKTMLGLLVASFLVVPGMVHASVTTTASSMVTDPMVLKASSGQLGIFSVTLAQTAGETLSSVAVTIANNGTSAVTGSDFASVSVYKDNGNGTFDSATDMLAGTQATVNVGTSTVVTTGSNNVIDGGKFFVSLATAASWSSGSSVVDSVTVQLAANALTTSANSPTVTAVTTSTITADTNGPTLSSAVAKNTGGTNAKEAGDTVELTFSESTNKFVVTAANIASVLQLNNSHSFLDGTLSLGGAVWNTEGTKLILTLSGGTSVPNIAVGDTVTVMGSMLMDIAGNTASGTVTISGNFGGTAVGDDDEDEGDKHGTKCANTLINGRLYKIGTETTVYLAASCRLKPFRGAAVFRARGHKFQNIIVLPSLPANVTISARPALPAAGTLVKGENATVWFVNKHGRKQGFVSANVFTNLGFQFKNVKEISNDDLSQIPEDDIIETDKKHPEGAIIKCQDATVFQVVGGKKFPFTSIRAFENRGNSFEHMLVVNCGVFSYVRGAPIEE